MFPNRKDQRSQEYVTKKKKKTLNLPRDPFLQVDT